MRRWVPASGATAVIVMPTMLAFFSGGYFDEPRIVAGLVAWCLVIAAGVAAARPLPVSAPGRIALLAIALWCAWVALSLTWAPLAGQAQDDLQRLLLYVGYFAASLAFLRVAGVARVLEPALALGAFAVVAYALSERVLPGALELERSASAGGRVEQPFTYWNAAGIAAAIGFVLATRTAGDPTRPRALRAALAGASVTLGLGVYLSFARGALAALAIALLVLIALAPEGRAQLRSVVVSLGAGAVASLVASGLPTVESLDSADSGEGLLMLGVLVVLSAAAAFLAPRSGRTRLPLPTPGGSRPAMVAIAGIAVAAIAAVAIAAFEGKPEFESPAAGATPERLGSIESTRYRYWGVALDTFAEHPLAGAGSGGFVVEWLERPDRPDAARDAHSLYLETAAELGLVGLALLVLFFGAVTAAGIRLYRLDRGAAAGPVAALTAWALHAALDWDWEMPAVTLTALLLAAWLIAASEEAVGSSGVSAGA